MEQNENKKNIVKDPDNTWVKEKINLLAPDKALKTVQARTRLNSMINEKERSVWQKAFAPRFRTAWVTLVVVGVLAATLSFPQIRVIANSFLGLFRVEQIEAVDIGISLKNLPQEMETRFSAVDNIIGDQLVIDKKVLPVEVGEISEASELAGFNARIPGVPTGDTQIHFNEASTVRLVIELEKWQRLLESMGYDDSVIPASADGAEVTFNVPAVVVVGIGDCEYNEVNEVKLAHPATENCTVFLQSRTPTIEAPPGVDINKAGQILLQALGMTPDEAEAFSATVNWATTLVVPVPSDINYQNVPVEGVDGIFLYDRYANGKSAYTLIWLKDGMLHALIGDGTLAEALRSVGSLK